ncbi:uncharacterized protein LOC129911459 [Episyrphus balteatus]|uniref:uncharacterized protein LOC129911459 n=1 Tax=Episyrphus balteatus TaxID=286459 RepID=UPI0024868BD4|nr:uncharacterized protein LOC129911459 [Episyrphus balteatus]
MKIILILSLMATLAYSAKLQSNRPVYILELLRSRTLADDFKDIKALIPQRELTDLIRRYLTKDSEFQKIILYFGSPDVYKAGELIGSQPEIRELYLWLKEQLISGSLSDLSEESYSQEFGNLLNYNPNKQKKLRGWKGFMDELLAIYPRKEIRNLIRDKVAANGVFAEFWSKVIALKPVYERILKTEELIKVIGRLNELGVDTKQLDQLIREDFEWGGGIQGKKLWGNLWENIKL